MHTFSPEKSKSRKLLTAFSNWNKMQTLQKYLSALTVDRRSTGRPTIYTYLCIRNENMSLPCPPK
jgi:hypothetical protein